MSCVQLNPPPMTSKFYDFCTIKLQTKLQYFYTRYMIYSLTNNFHVKRPFYNFVPIEKHLFCKDQNLQYLELHQDGNDYDDDDDMKY